MLTQDDLVQLAWVLDMQQSTEYMNTKVGELMWRITKIQHALNNTHLLRIPLRNRLTPL